MSGHRHGRRWAGCCLGASAWALEELYLCRARLYAKLQPASQLKRRAGRGRLKRYRAGFVLSAGVAAVTPARHEPKDVLVVAFAASQAEPEWLGAPCDVVSLWCFSRS